MSSRVRWTTVVIAAALLLPAGADGAWKIKGRGFGHGVGLSQYGAFGFAERGKGYKRILRHYYRGTKIGRAGADPVRVLLGNAGNRVNFRGAARACGERLNRKKRYSFVADGGGAQLRGPSGQRIKGCGREGKASGGTLAIGGFGRYRGSLVARAESGDLLVINRLRLEGYVKGVVANEVPASWPQAALRSQAVVARSYGTATERSGAFDHYDDTRSQVYGGKSSETRATNKAVEATTREVVKYKGKTAITYYFSTSGGRTENSEFGFSGGSKVPYLKSVKDPYDKVSPVHRWRERVSDKEMEARLSGLFAGRLKKIEVLDTGRTPRIVRARVVGSRSSSTVSGDTLRARLGLRSTWARFKHR